MRSTSLSGGNLVDGVPHVASQHEFGSLRMMILKMIIKIDTGGKPSTRFPPERLVELIYILLKY